MAKAMLALPEAFGDGNFDMWLRKFEVCGVANGWKDDDTGRYAAMTELRNRKRKPSEDLDVYAFALESALRRAMLDVGEGNRNTLLRQQFIEGGEENL